MSYDFHQPNRPAADSISEVRPVTGPLDTAAFDGFASLRGLIREAAGEADLLREATGNAASTRNDLATSAAEIEAKLSRFADLIPIIEERLKEIDTLLSASAAYAARVADDLDERIAATIREHLRSHLLRDIQPQIERLVAARLDGFLTDFGALTFPESRRAA